MDRDPAESPPDLAADLPPPRLGDRALFPALRARAYLNHAAISPPSARVRAAIRRCTDDYAADGVAALFPWLERRRLLRAELAALIGAAPDTIGLTMGTSPGITAVALGFPWRPGDRVILFTGEFPANVTPWQRAADLFDLRPVFLPLADFEASHERGLARLEEALRAGARLVAASTVQFQTGLRMPIAAMAELCRRHGAALAVDAIQACGVVPIDVAADGVDFLACGAHKWLMGVEGAGFLYVRPDRAAELRPAVASWLSHDDPIRFLFGEPGHLRYDRPIRARADLVEGSAANVLGHAALHAAVGPLRELGVAAIFDHVQRYLDALEGPLVERGFRSRRAADPAARSGILSLAPPPGVDLHDLQARLAAEGVACTTPDGHLRFAPHWPNDLAELPVVLDAVDRALAR